MEMCREKMHDKINKNGLNHSDTIQASQELDEEIVREMLKDPVVKIQYLERVIEARDARIDFLMSTIKVLRKRLGMIENLAEVAVMKYESGLKAKEAIGITIATAIGE